MSAVFTGNGLGLFGSSLSELGTSFGQSQVGSGRQLVNVATGNLLLQEQDEVLQVRGLSTSLVRTYNSLGLISTVGRDGFVTGYERSVSLSGTLNTAGSTMTLQTGDGHGAAFTYSGTADVYTCTQDSGAHDTLTWDSTSRTWTYVEGSTRREETYGDHDDATLQGRLIRIRDLKSDGTTPAEFDVLYDILNRISEVRSIDGAGASADAILFGYNGITKQLTSISTREGGNLRTQVSYGYDEYSRLSWVQTDLTPADSSDNTWDATTPANNDGHSYRTSYTYVTQSVLDLRLSGVTFGDGTTTSYTYDASNRIQTVTCGTETTTYTYGSNATTVTDSLNRSWIYAYDNDGHLTSVTAPPIGGQSDVTMYSYDGSGNVTQVKTVRGAEVLSQVDNQYDGSGNLLWQWTLTTGTNAVAVQRTYSATQQLLTETQFTGLDADGADATSTPSGGLTTHYIYDAQDRLRATIDATGSVTEFTYANSGNGIGQQDTQRKYTGATYSGAYTEAELASWATAAQKVNSQLTTYQFDAKGRLSQATAFASVDASGSGIADNANQVTLYTYDAQGLLRQQTVGHGATSGTNSTSTVTDYTYDGLGRLLGMVQHASGVSSPNDVNSISTSYAYLDSSLQLSTTTDAGATRLVTRNTAGHIISVVDSGVVGSGTVTRTSTNTYDAAGQLRATTDANGAVSYFFYDAKGRLEATVDATGAVTRSVFDGADRITQTIQYANRVTTTDWLSGGSVTKAVFADIGVVADGVNDRVVTSTYDKAGRLATVVDAASGGSITTYTYDGANRLSRVRVTDAAGTVETARNNYFFYDDAGRLVMTEDADKYVVENVYDAGGRLSRTIRYANFTMLPLGDSPSIVRPLLDSDNDQTTRFFYDGRGNLTGALDAEGYLTEWVLDEAGNTRAERRYANDLTWNSSDTLATLRSRAGTYREIRSSYNALGLLETQTNQEGTVTRYSYDEAGRLVQTTTAEATTDVRDNYTRLNVFGEVIGEISGEQAANAILAGFDLNDPALTETQKDLAYATYGITYTVDSLGRRIESVDASGNKVWYFYDNSGRQTFLVRGVAQDNAGDSHALNSYGEVVESRYNAFGQLSDSLVYTGRIAITTPGSRSSVATALSTLSYVSTVDSKRSYTYNVRGLLSTTVNAELATTTYAYDAWRNLTTIITASEDATQATTSFSFDKRGNKIGSIEAVGLSEQRSSAQQVDAFGRVTSTSDGRGVATKITYDRIGRLLTASRTVQGRVEQTTTTYDAYSRVLTQFDALGNPTTYQYNDAARSVIVTTPEQVAITTIHNRYGQTVAVSQVLPDGTTATATNTYDRNGALISTTDALGNATHNTYDARGLLIQAIDASGRKVDYTYDAVGRELTRTQDAGGLNLVTKTGYDGQGRMITLTDASQRVTAYSYDREGRLTQVARDPDVLNLRTKYEYDKQGRQVTLTEGYGTTEARVTKYTYDALGRRTSEAVDPAGLNLVTQYLYDANDNVIRKTDAELGITRYVYDQANRLVYSIDANGTLTRNDYDADGRVVAARQYAAKITFSPSEITSLESITGTGGISVAVAKANANANDAVDAVSYRIYNEDGQLRYTVNTLGAVVELQYDSVGHQIVTRAYVNAIALNSTLRSNLQAGTAVGADLAVTADDTRDVRSYQTYDHAGRVHYTLVRDTDTTVVATETIYDAAGRVVESVRHGVSLTLSGTPTDGQVTSALQALSQTTWSTDLSTATPDGLDVSAVGAYGNILTYDSSGQRLVFTKAGYTSATYATIFRTETHDAADETVFSGEVTTGADLSDTYLIFSIENLKSGVDYRRAGAFFQDGVLYSNTFSDGSGTNTALGAFSANTTYVVEGHSHEGGVDYYVYVKGTNKNDGFRFSVSFDDKWDTVRMRDYAYGGPGFGGNPLYLDNLKEVTLEKQQRTIYAYDGAGRLIRTTDSLGASSTLAYDGAGRVETRTDALGNETSYTYDKAGRNTDVKDALNNSEHFTYDSVGNKISFTDKLEKVWTYEYDKAGRLTDQTGPVVAVGSVDDSGIVTQVQRSIATHFTYDDLGNVLTRTEDYGQPSARTTTYAYDATGHQTRVTFPDAYKLDASNNLVASGSQATVEITYDTLGRAVVQKDVNNHYSYKVYDAAGRLAYDVDQEGYVTAYRYDSLGRQTQLTRYANGIAEELSGWGEGVPVTLSQIQAAGVITTSASDRVLTTAYDIRGNKSNVKQKAVAYYDNEGNLHNATQPTTVFTYNALGQLAVESVLIEGDLWADTYHYYDTAGREIMTVDAEGYVTTLQYNAAGQVAERIEYAKAVDLNTLSMSTPPALPPPGDASSGYDRIVFTTYDELGRKSSETVRRSYAQANGDAGMRDVVTVLGYDAVGRLTTTTVDGVLTLQNTFDAMGRIRIVQEAGRDVLRSDANSSLLGDTDNDLSSASLYEQVSPYTTLLYDAFGNQVQSRRYANGYKTSGGAVQSANDQITVTRYDHQGRAVMTIDAVGNSTYNAYDAGDHVVHTWMTLDGSVSTRDAKVNATYTYDKTGKQLTNKVTRQLLTGGTTYTERDDVVTYNAFGEVITKKVNGFSDVITYSYDAAGHMTGNNESGAARAYGYNLAGAQVREQHSVSEYDAGTNSRVTNSEVTRQVVDHLGRVVLTVLPSYTSNRAVTTTVVNTLDRWGNVVCQIDPRGYMTRYEYNEFNQKTREVAPPVEVVGEDGRVTWQMPETHWMYDALGRLVAVRDANDNVHQLTYNNAGQVVRTTDGTGATTMTAFDALGNARYSQDALGHITWQTFDKNGRVVAQGDMLPNSAGTARTSTTLQQYTLNSAGQRVVVKDALNHTTLYDLNSQNQLIRSETAEGVVVTDKYDALGHKTSENDGIATQTWEYDIFGRLQAHSDLSNKSSSYTYNATSGQLTDQTNTWGANADIYYYSNGLVRRRVEGANVYSYQYDANGNRTVEDTTTTDPAGYAIHQITTSTYDSNNRLARVISKDANTGVILMDVRYGYDAVGNRRVVVVDSDNGTNVTDWNPTNAAPVVIGHPENRSVKAGVLSMLYVQPSLVFQDRDQLPLTYSATLSNGDALPSWLTLDAGQLASTGKLAFTCKSTSTAGQSAVVRLRATDPNGASVTVDFTINVVSNTAPVSLPGSNPIFRGIVGKELSVELAAGAFFRDGDAGDTLTLSLNAILPSAPWLNIDASTPGALRLTGTPTAAGSYALTLRATDATGATVDRTIQIIVAANTAPVAKPALPLQTASIGQEFEIEADLDDLFTDANDDTLVLTAKLSNGAALPAWMALEVLNDANPPTVRIVGQVPPDQQAQTFSIVLTAKDPGGLSATNTITLKVAADPGVFQVLNPLLDKTLTPGSAWSYVIPSNTFARSNTGVPITYAASGMPPGFTFNATTRTISGTPTTSGTWSVTITATAGGESLSESFDLTVKNVKPAGSTPDQVLTAGSAFNLTLPAYSDANGDTLTYSATISPSGSGITFNPATRKFGGTPPAGTYTITVTVNDGHGGVLIDVFALAVSTPGVAPKVGTGLVDQSTMTGQTFQYVFSATAFTGTGLTYTATGYPSWLVFDAAQRKFYGTANGPANNTYTITVTATNAYGSVSDSFTLFKEGDVGGNKLMALNGEDSLLYGGGGDESLAGMNPMPALEQTLAVTMVNTSTAYALGNTTDTRRNYQASWYTYDGENRTLISDGNLSSGQIVLKAAGQWQHGGLLQQYDAVGNLVTTVSDDGYNTIIRRNVYDLRGQRTAEITPQKLGETASSLVVKRYTYDNAGRLTETRSYYPSTMKVVAPLDGEGYPKGPPMSIGGWLSGAEQYTYDDDGRLLTLLTKNRASLPQWTETPDTATQTTSLSVLSNQSYVDYTSGGVGRYDAAGRLTGYSYTQYQGTAFTFNYLYGYEGRDQWLEKTISGSSPNNSYKATTSTSTYDAYGRRTSVVETSKIDNNTAHDLITKRLFAYDADGGILSRRDGYMKNNVWTQADESNGQLGNPSYKWIDTTTWNAYTSAQRIAVVTASKDQRFAYVNGQMIGQTDLAGAKLDATTRLTAYSSSDVGAGSVTVQDGDTLKSIAQRVYGEESLWYVLADANAIDDDSQLVAGTELKAPQVTTHQNDANTFKPYDPNQVIGPTTPSLPYVPPPPKQHCNTLAMVLVVVVAVIVTVYTAGAASFAMSGLTAAATAGETVAAAAIGAAAGSIAGQAVGSVLGVSSFSWRQVAVDTITGAATAGAGAYLKSSGGVFTNAAGDLSAAGRATQAVAGYAGTVVGNTIVGRDAHFSWNAVAQTAVGAYVSAKIGGELPITQGGSPGKNMVNNFGGLFLDGTANATVSRVFGGPKQDWGQIATDAFGNALANGLVGKLQSGQQQRSRDEDFLTPAQEAYARQLMFSQAQTDGMGGFEEPDYSVSSGDITIPGNGDVPRSNAFSILPPEHYADQGQRDQFIAWAMFNGAPVFDSGEETFDNYYQSYQSLGDFSGMTLDTVQVTAPDYVANLLEQNAGVGIFTTAAIAQATQRIQHRREVQENYNAYIRRAYPDVVSSGVGRPYMNDAQFKDWQQHDNLSLLKLTSAGPGLGITAAGATLSPAIAMALSAYGAYEGGEDILSGHPIRGGLTLAASLVGGGLAANELRAADSVKSIFWNSESALKSSGKLSFNGIAAADRNYRYQLTDDLISTHLAGNDVTPIARELAEIYTHEVAGGPRSGQVILGHYSRPFETAEMLRYYNVAQREGGIWFQTDDAFFPALIQGLGGDEAAAADLAFKVNEQFLLIQADRGVDSFNLTATTRRFVMNEYPNSGLAKEIRFLDKQLPSFGYKWNGTSWVKY